LEVRGFDVEVVIAGKDVFTVEIGAIAVEADSLLQFMQEHSIVVAKTPAAISRVQEAPCYILFTRTAHLRHSHLPSPTTHTSPL
jgi:hypothetical protein